MRDLPLEYSEEVRTACNGGRAMVALESTVISHGLPWPANFEAAIEMEERVRTEGAVPATIAVLDGRLCIGLSVRELERLARGADVSKASARDLPFLVAERRSGATTVAGTCFLAHRAGIAVMATGGIGGVHRGVLETGDVSADLMEMARRPLMVVCSGAKAILDLPRTFELLESLGVPVVGYQCDEFPAFFARSSGIRLERRVETPEQAAQLIRASRAVGLPGGIVLANPPPEPNAIEREELERIVIESLAAAHSAEIRGKSLTPYLLRVVRERAGPRAAEVNRALLAANAQLAAQIARKLVDCSQ